MTRYGHLKFFTLWPDTGHRASDTQVILYFVQCCHAVHWTDKECHHAMHITDRQAYIVHCTVAYSYHYLQRSQHQIQQVSIEYDHSPPQLLPLIQTRRLRFFGHVTRMSDSQDTFRALQYIWRRRPGRPRHTWLRTINADPHPLNHGLNSAWRLAQDRERWRQLVETATLQPGARSWWWW